MLELTSSAIPCRIATPRVLFPSMNNILTTPDPVTTHWDCPECGGTGTLSPEICPVCLGAKYIDLATITNWMLDFMESRGCDPDEIEQLRTENADPLTLTFCLEICIALK
ncbi:hypothetical protein [Microcoleus vaginatus]|uniref:hypothetical protein n=1 Tax=Microcoleus vaginatus TaxID=119532 RepID=UPI0032A3DB23